MATQARLLRVLEAGEFIKVGSSKVLKTNVRLVAATNINISQAIEEGKFRQDLYYRLNTVPILIPPLRERKDDILLLFRKFTVDFSEKYRMPPLELDNEAKQMLTNFRWPGNIRQLKNLTEQISIIEQNRLVTGATLRKYLPDSAKRDLPILYSQAKQGNEFTERELLYKVLFDMRRDITELKKLVGDIIGHDNLEAQLTKSSHAALDHLYNNINNLPEDEPQVLVHHSVDQNEEEDFSNGEVLEESLSLQQKEMDMIRRALDKYSGRRRNAAKELGISERTLYRKIKEYGIKG
jgi:transcriptional regulator with PAS, ATPase and Fis domain